RRSALALLDDVRQLMRNKPPTVARVRAISTGAEDDVASDRISQRIDRMSGRAGAFIGVNTNVTEVASKTWFHECARRAIERMTGRAENIVDYLRRATRSFTPGRGA